MIISFIVAAIRGFKDGDERLLAVLWREGIFGNDCNQPPSDTAYAKACSKIPEEAMMDVLKLSHKATQKGSGGLYKTMRAVAFDGTKIIIQRSEENLAKYSPAKTGGEEGYYPQIHAVCMYDLGSKSFMDVDIGKSFASERECQRTLSDRWSEETLLEVGDAGFAGIGNCLAIQLKGHHALFRLKTGSLKEIALASKKRSKIVEITLTKAQLEKTPELMHLVGTKIKLRVIRTEGTTTLRSTALVTTLLDEKLYPWWELQNLYLGRVQIEVGFRHLKTIIRIEEIKKRTSMRTTQLIIAAMIAYNAAAILRNCYKKQSLMPEEKSSVKNCFEYGIECVTEFIFKIQKGRRRLSRRLIKVIISYGSCEFKYLPWRFEPRIRKRPVSEFAQLSKGAKAVEIQTCLDFKEDMKKLGRQYERSMKR